MRRVIAFCLALVLALSCAPLCAAAPVRAGEASIGSLIKERCYTYEDGQKYSGKTVTPQLDVSAFADLTVVEDGGSHTDGRGEPVFSNYVVFSVKLNFDSSKRIIGTDARVSKDRCDWNETAYAAAGDTEQYIAYGAIGAERRDGEGKKVSYEPMFSKGNTSVENLVFNEDGNYTVFVLYESVKDGKYQNHVIEWSFSIRSYVYLVDGETGYPIKESGTSDRTVRVDYAKRQGVTLECTFTDVDGRTSSFFASDGYRMEQSGTYRFTTRAAGFVCESFTFLLDTSSPCDRLMFANLCRMIGEYS